MRGFALAAMVLVGLDLVLRAPATRVAAALSTPTAWLAKWMDANTPLITRPVPQQSGGGGGIKLPGTNYPTFGHGTVPVPGVGNVPNPFS